MPMTSSQLHGMDTAGSSAPLLHEILTKVNNAKDKSKKIDVLRENDSVPLRQILKGAFDPKIKWDLPEGTPPYKVNDAPAGTEHTTLHTESRRLWHFVEGADKKLSKSKKEIMFIQMLEGLHADDAKLLVAVKEKELNKMYKGLTDAVVKDAFRWNEEYKTF
jgi:hypothetical protein|tara:strand:- start:20200 stop:20685 length:486 start_codon:yes stop_codon:yes gene_type:complete